MSVFKPPATLRGRLIALVLFSLVPAMLVMAYAATASRRRAIDDVRQNAVTLVNLVSAGRQDKVDDARRLLFALSLLQEVRGGGPALCNSRLDEILQTYPDNLGLGVADADGRVVCQAGAAVQPANVAGQTWFRRALETGRFALGDYEAGAVPGQSVLTFAYPILEITEEGQTPVGVVFTMTPLPHVSQAAADAPLPNGTVMWSIDSNGTVTDYYPEPETRGGQTRADDPLIQRILAEGQGTAEMPGLDGISRLYAFAPLDRRLASGHFVVVGLSQEVAAAELDRVFAGSVGLLALVGLLTVALAWWGSEAFILRWIRRLMNATDQLSRGDLSARAELPPATGEIGQLGAAFNQMAEALEQRQREGRLAEEALRQSRDEVAAILQGAAEGITAQDRDGRLRYANDAAARLLGFATAEELLAAPVAEVVQKFAMFDETGQPFPAEKLPGRLAMQAQPGGRGLGGAPAPSAIIRYRVLATGQEHWSAVKATPVYNAQGQVELVVNLFQDITRLKEAEINQRLLAEVGRLAAEPLDPAAQLTRIAQLAVPTLADWCAVDVLSDDEVIERVAVAHVEPAKVEMAAELQRRYPPDPAAATGVPQVLRSGVSEFYPVITQEMIDAAALDDEQLEILRVLNLKSVMIVPLNARGRTLGALTFVSTVEGRHFQPTHLELAEELARRAALALDNASLYAEAQKLNARLEELVDRRTAQLLAANTRLTNEVAERKEAQRRLEESQAQLRRLSAHLQAAREEERMRIAREVHDELGQNLAGLMMSLAWLQRAWADQDGAVEDKMRDMAGLIENTVATVRRIVTELRPRILDEFGLAAAIEWQVKEFQQRTGLECELQSNVADLNLAAGRATAVFRLLQEALTNIVRHAEATRVVVSIEQEADQLIFRVEDDGRGISQADLANSKSFGVLGMRERVAMLQGEISIHGGPAGGTVVEARIPVQNAGS